MKNRLKTSYIIHIFALLHALVAVFCLGTGIDDEMLLTVLTMTMTVIICIQNKLPFEISAIFIILVNIAGYMIGTGSARLIDDIISSRIASASIATAITTEIVGWASLLVGSMINNAEIRDDNLTIDRRVNWIITAVIIIFVLRITYAGFLSANKFTHATILYILKEIISDSACMITTIGLNFIFIGYAGKWKSKVRPLVKYLILALFLAGTTAVSTLITNANLFHDTFKGFSHLNFFQVFSVMFLVEITLYCITYLIVSTVGSRRQAQMEREKANWEKYRYLRLKQQVNPHFLFNSLNILDCLVCEEKTEQASTYIHKLASIYRYFLRNEDTPTITLKDELEFSNQYMDLLKVRFQDGFRVEQDIPEGCLQKHVIPCSLQMLIENAFKHNAIQAGNPLTLTISADGDYLTVSNNIIPKHKENTSTGVGQIYISQQYKDIASKDILIENTGTTYIVKLPLL